MDGFTIQNESPIRVEECVAGRWLKMAAARLGGLTQEQFKIFDTDGDGRLSQAELEDYLGEGGCFGCHGPKKYTRFLSSA